MIHRADSPAMEYRLNMRREECQAVPVCLFWRRYNLESIASIWILTYLYSYPAYIEPDSFFAKSENYLPTNIMFVQSVMKQECSQELTVFFDSGLKYTYFNKTALPIDATPLLLSIRLLLEVLSKWHGQSIYLLYPFLNLVRPCNMIQSKLGYSESLLSLWCNHWRNFFAWGNVGLCLSDGNMRCSNRVVPMKKASGPSALFIGPADDAWTIFWFPIFQSQVWRSGFASVVAAQTHLDDSQRGAALERLYGHGKLFRGKLRVYTNRWRKLFMSMIHSPLEVGSWKSSYTTRKVPLYL